MRRYGLRFHFLPSEKCITCDLKLGAHFTLILASHASSTDAVDSRQIESRHQPQVAAFYNHLYRLLPSTSITSTSQHLTTIKKPFNMVHSALNGCDIVAVGQYKDWQDPKVKNWVKCARGKISFQPRLTEQTTHLVVAEKQWKDQTAIVQDAIKRNEQGQKIHILSHEWLDESLQSKAKRAESTHSWVKKASAAMKTKVVGQPRSTAGLMSQVFADSTNAFLSDAAKSKMAKRVQLEREEREEEEKRTQETFKKQRESDNLKTLATIFTRAFHKGRQQLLADTYHICVDGMGFAWNVALEPVEKTGSPQDLPSMRVSRTAGTLCCEC